MRKAKRAVAAGIAGLLLFGVVGPGLAQQMKGMGRCRWARGRCRRGPA